MDRFLGRNSASAIEESSVRSIPVSQRSQQNQEIDQLLNLMELFNGGSITSTMTDSGATVTRFALTLNLR
jgi:hypothetical protein